ncbi:MAG: hypothetical protein JOY54_18275 [Acidobacteriaceae bacterium]|nr:hypothetical protein [Acidobacteriaceae bacterium]
MIVYQPQLESWTGNTLSAYAAVAVKTQGSSETAYGVIWFTARTEVDKVNRSVTLNDFNHGRLAPAVLWKLRQVFAGQPPICSRRGRATLE